MPPCLREVVASPCTKRWNSRARVASSIPMRAGRLELGDIEDVVQDRQQVVRRFLGRAEVVGLLRRERRLLQQRHHSEHAVKWGADLVAHVGEKDALAAAGLLGLDARGPQVVGQRFEAAPAGRQEFELPHHREAEQQQQDALEQREREADPAVLRDRCIARRRALVQQVRGTDRQVVQRAVEAIQPGAQFGELGTVQACHGLAAERAVGVCDEGAHLLDRRAVGGLLAHRFGSARMVDQADPAHEDVVAQLQQLRIGRDAVVELDLDLVWCCTLFGT